MREIRPDPDEIAPLLRMAYEIDQQRPGLGFLTVYMYASRIGCRYSSLGRGNMLAAPKSWGKGQIVRATNQNRLGTVIEVDDYLSKKWLHRRIQKGILSKRPIKHISISFEDLTQAVSQRYWFGNTFNNLSTLLSEKSFAYKRKDYTGSGFDRAYQFDSASFIGGCTHRTLMRIRNHYNWSEQWGDRITVAAILYRPRDIKRQRAYHEAVESRKLKAKDPASIVKGWINSFPKEVPLDVTSYEITNLYRALFGSQVLPNRGREYVKSDLRGLAVLAGLDSVTQSISDFAQLMAPYFRVGSQTARRIQITQFALVNNPSWELQNILDQLGWSDPHYLEDQIRFLNRQGLLSMRGNGGSPRYRRVIVGDELRVGLDSIEELRAMGARLSA